MAKAMRLHEMKLEWLRFLGLKNRPGQSSAERGWGGADYGGKAAASRRTP